MGRDRKGKETREKHINPRVKNCLGARVHVFAFKLHTVCTHKPAAVHFNLWPIQCLGKCLHSLMSNSSYVLCSVVL